MTDKSTTETDGTDGTDVQSQRMRTPGDAGRRQSEPMTEPEPGLGDELGTESGPGGNAPPGTDPQMTASAPTRDFGGEVLAWMWRTHFLRDIALFALMGALIGAFLAYLAIGMITVPTIGSEGTVIIGGVIFGAWAGIGAMTTMAVLFSVTMVYLGSTIDDPL